MCPLAQTPHSLEGKVWSRNRPCLVRAGLNLLDCLRPTPAPAPASPPILLQGPDHPACPTPTTQGPDKPGGRTETRDALLQRDGEVQTQRGGRKQRGGAHLLELPLGDAVAVEDDAGGLEARGLVELDEQLAHHGRQVLDDLLPVLLHAHGGAVAVRVGVHAAHDLWGSGLSRRPEGQSRANPPPLRVFCVCGPGVYECVPKNVSLPKGPNKKLNDCSEPLFHL